MRSKEVTEIADETYSFKKLLFLMGPEGVAGVSFTQFPVSYILGYSKMQ